MPEPRPPPSDRTAAQRAGRPRGHRAPVGRRCVPALIAKLHASGLGELEVREGDWRLRLRRPAGAVRRRPSLPSGPRRGPTRPASPRPRAPAPPRPTAPLPPTTLRGTEPAPRREASPRRPRSASSSPRSRRVGTRVRAGDRLAIVDLLGVPQDVVAPDRRHRRSRSSPRPARPWSTAQELVGVEAEPGSPPPVAAPVTPAARTGRPDRGQPGPHRQPRRDRPADPARLPDARASRPSSPTARPTATSLPASSPTRPSASAPPTPGARTSRRRPIISAALVTGCDAIHPGYGFLSEDDAFADAVRAHDLTFIGPPAEVLERFASKEETRRLLAAHGLPTIPGSAACCATRPHALEEAERIGYPVLLKPSAGGGGKGMRMVRSPRELEPRSCRSAGPRRRPAFGDDSLYLEKWLEDNRHVEVQVAVDRFGHGVHLGERDCSVQRRHQKILEESPVPGPDPGRPPRAGRAGHQGGRRRRLRERRHARVPRGQRRQRLLHRDQLPHPGGAPGHRDAHRHRPRGHCRSGSPPASRWASPRRTSRSAATPSSSGSTPRTRPTTSGPGAGTSSGSTPRAARASGWTRTSTRATRSRPTTTRCSASSSSGAPTREAAIARGRAALGELVVEGVVTNAAIHRALLDLGAVPRRPDDHQPAGPRRQRRVPRRCRSERRSTATVRPPHVQPCTDSPRSRRRRRSTLPPTPNQEPPVTDANPTPPAAARPPPPRPGTVHSVARDRGADPASLAVPARRPDRRVRPRREADRRPQGRHRHRVVLPGPLPGPAGHARRPPGGGARPDDGRLRGQAAGLRRPDRAVRGDRRVSASSGSSSRATSLRLEVTMEKLGSRFGRGPRRRQRRRRGRLRGLLSASSSRRAGVLR